MQGVANRTPILRNAAFASVPSRNPQARSLAQSTFRGGFAQDLWASGAAAITGPSGVCLDL
jgi:hypothetical protein